MARPLRIEYPGAIYHVTSRGNDRQAIYETKADRYKFLKLIEQACKRHQWLKKKQKKGVRHILQ